MIRSALKHFIVNSATLYFVSLIISGIIFQEGIYTILLSGVVLTITAMIIRPIINILLLPLNLITFGLFRWVGFAITLYIVTLVVPGFKLLSFTFNGLSSNFISLPAFAFTGILAFIAYSFLISLISSFISWIFK